MKGEIMKIKINEAGIVTIPMTEYKELVATQAMFGMLLHAANKYPYDSDFKKAFGVAVSGLNAMFGGGTAE